MDTSVYFLIGRPKTISGYVSPFKIITYGSLNECLKTSSELKGDKYLLHKPNIDSVTRLLEKLNTNTSRDR